jgi:hypothetical protein
VASTYSAEEDIRRDIHFETLALLLQYLGANHLRFDDAKHAALAVNLI